MGIVLCGVFGDRPTVRCRDYRNYNMAWWANRHHAGKMHMLWGKGSTMGDAEAEEEWERAKFVRMDIDKLDKP